ncbi:sensor histidine kinase [Arcobacter porcinus]|uniref:histidine kinase n=1 Tax=Arcobacter porcinus TaxID=1935204 RepID=A0ABX2YDW7_9BACT|nr:HAMP domain-containing sensor histidine kinase [Arcobacter porcinus]OCL93194.1 Sporulation kinase D [Arcobacter porcinus]
MKKIWKNLITSNYAFIGNSNNQRRGIILNITLLIMIILFLPLSIYNFFNRDIVTYAIIEFSTSILLICIIFYIRYSKNLTIASNIVAAIVILNITSYIYTENGQNNSFIWISSFIAFIFYLKGLKKGLFISFIFAICLFLFMFSLILNSDSYFNIVSFINVGTSFFVFLGILFFYHYLLDVAEKKLLKLNKNLSKRVKIELEKKEKQNILLIQKSKLEDLGETFAMLTHQWQQPLSIIFLETNILLDKLENSENIPNENKKDIEIILNNISNKTKFMFETLNDFNNFLSPYNNQSNFSPYNSILKMSSFIEATFKLKNIDISFTKTCDKKSLVFGKENEFKQTILSILTNSAQSINIKQKEDINYKGEIIIDLKRDNFLIISIKDNGTGLLINNYFEPYITSKENGTGLGLYMSKLIINKMKGNITLRNHENGCEVLLEIPILK